MRRSALCTAFFVIFPTLALAAELPTIDVNQIVPAAARNTLIKTLGSLTSHRPFEGASSLGNPGIDIGVEAVLMHLPEDFGSSLSELGMASSEQFASASLPMAKLHFHKGLGKTLDFGASGLYYGGNHLWGIDLKVIISEPEEGPTWAFRFIYSETALELSKFGIKGIPLQAAGFEVGSTNLKLDTRTISPQLLLSRRLDFAEPYLGAGVEFTSGQIEIIPTLTVLGESRSQSLPTEVSRSTQFRAFSGLSFRVPNSGLRIALEGSFGHLGMHTIGAWVGFGL